MGALDLSKLKVLIVDDSRHMRALMRDVMKSLGVHTIFEASDGEEALEVLKFKPVNITLLDLHMKPMGGIEFLLELRKGKDSPDPFMPVIIATGDSTITTIQAARDAGVSTFLAKPITVRSLVEKLTFILKDKRKFIRAKTYAGPDRRFRIDDGFPGPKRRRTDPKKSGVEKQKVKA